MIRRSREVCAIDKIILLSEQLRANLDVAVAESETAYDLSPSADRESLFLILLGMRRENDLARMSAKAFHETCDDWDHGSAVDGMALVLTSYNSRLKEFGASLGSVTNLLTLLRSIKDEETEEIA